MDDRATGTTAMDAILPLTAEDWPRFQKILRPSLERHFEPLATCWVVMPDRDAKQFAQHFGGGPFSLIAESDVITLSLIDRLKIAVVRKQTGIGDGWFTQQVVKLVGASLVNTAFYLTLDADVICTRLTRYSDLVHGNRAITQVHVSDIHREWYRWTENAFGFRRRGAEFGRTHPVTPVVLSRTAIALLSDEVCSGSSSPEVEADPLGVIGRNREQFSKILFERLPWTEYTLYFSFLETRDLFDRFHVESNGSLYGNCVWSRDDFFRWDPQSSFERNAPFFFTVVQSNSVSVDELLPRLALHSNLFA